MAKRGLIILMTVLSSSSSALGRLTDPACSHTQSSLLSTIDATAEALDQLGPLIEASGTTRKKEAGIYGEDNRQLIERDEYPWKAIGKLAVGRSHCTAVMVSACHALTAAHCLVDHDPSKGMVSLLGDNEVTSFRSSNGTTAAGVSKTVVGAGNYRADGRQDFAFIKLDRSIGTELGWMGVANVSASDLKQGWVSWLLRRRQEHLTIAGFSSDILAGNWMSVDNAVEFVREDRSESEVLRFRGNTFSGSSGAPIWRLDSHGRPEIVGVNTRAVMQKTEKGSKQYYLKKDEDEALAVGVSSRVFGTQLKKFIDENPCSP